jgi:parallel beta-helix repeat protein
MKKLLTFLAAFIIWSMQTVLATDVSGTISTNTTWTLAGSPYIVTSSVTINHGVALTIQSGVTVKFDNSQSLYVNGIMNATGVIFTSNSASPVPGDWGYIQVGNWNTNDSGNVVLNSCQMLYATQFYVFKGIANLTNTDLTNFSNYGVFTEENGTFNISGGNINTNSSWALTYGSGIHCNPNSHSTISGVNIQHFLHGILLSDESKAGISDINVTNCIWPITYTQSADLTAGGTNSFVGNTNSVVNMGFYNFADTLTLPVLNIPYYFQGGLNVEAGGRLVVGSNNILKFPDYSALEINGTLIANANVGENIFFTSYRDDNWGGDSNNDGTITAPSSGNWYGIRFHNQSNDAYCVMRRCQVRYAGYGNIGGISTFDASPTIDLCDLSNNYFGIYMQYASNPVFSNNTIGSSQMTPIAMSFEADPVLSNNILSFSDNAYDAIGLIGGILSTNATLKKRSVTSVPNITYLLLSQLTIPSGKSLTINKGIVIKSYSSEWDKHRIIVEGTLTANATVDSMITFTSARDDIYGNPSDCNKDGTMTSPAVGDWGGIVFAPGGTGIMNYCRFKYGRVYDYGFSSCSMTEYVNETAVAMIDASPTISNCEFKDLTYGISCYRASNPALSNLSMINTQFTPINISGSANPTITNITYTNVGWNAIGLLGGNVCQNGNIKKRDIAGFTNITYVLLSDMTINSGTSVNVDPGVVIKVNGCNLFVDGGFKTDGTSTQGVVFTSIKDDNAGNPFDSNGDGNATTPAGGNWGSIKFRSTSNDAYCILNYTSIKYGGNTNEGGVTFENAGGQLTNSIISNTSNYGVYCNGNSTANINNVILQNCSLDPIAMSLTSNPTFTNITFVSNFSRAIKIIEGELSSNATLSPRNVAGITNIAYIMSNLTISSNAKLTIQPGVVVKLRADNYCGWYLKAPLVIIHGNLIANGTIANKIYFTSFADDSKGGDSNNDGNTTTPAIGDWGGTTINCDNQMGGLRFINNSLNSDTVNSLKNCEISYAATGVRTENSHITIDSCIIQQTMFGATIRGSSNPNIKNSQFYNISHSPIELSMFSNPTFTNCSALNVGYIALAVVPETYSQSDTVPVRNFGGYANIGYYMEGASTINSGTTITIPAGIVFKSSNNSESYTTANGFIVNGRLNIQGTSGNPVIFTHAADDSYGNPLDMNQNGSATAPPDGYSWGEGWTGNWIVFNDVSDDLSSIDYAILKYGDKGITTLSASPLINHSRFEQMYYGVDMNGVSAPGIDNSTFHNLRYFPMQISLVSYPTTSSNNVISGTTYKVIKVRDEMLTQDVTLTKRNFGGVTNIPYYWEHYAVGTGATLTFNPGIVNKFKVMGPYWESDLGISVYKGFSALGGSTPDSNIVFTDIRDDNYGGDSNSDSSSTSPARGSWIGLIFQDQSLDPLCKLKNCIIRYGDKGIFTTSASPTVTNCNINNNNYGVYAAAASNPVFSNCDFNDNFYFAVNNVDKSFVINAENCWWGSNSGPLQTNTPGDGSSIQELVTDDVDYTPWKTTGSVNPLMGDASLNGLVQAYDASLVLQKVVGSITFNSTQMMVADVSATAGVTAYDASLILQYVVGLIQSFPAELTKSDITALTSPQLSVGSASVLNGQEVAIPISVSNIAGMSATEITLQYDPQLLQISQVENVGSTMDLLYRDDSTNGILTIAMAGTYSLSADAVLVRVTFRSTLQSGNSLTTALIVNKFLANESNLTSNVVNGSITITDNASEIADIADNVPTGMSPVSPNPSTGNAILIYRLSGENQLVTIDVFDFIGQKVTTLVNDSKGKGEYSVSVSAQGNPLSYGSYLIRMTVDGVSTIQKFQIVR